MPEKIISLQPFAIHVDSKGQFPGELIDTSLKIQLIDIQPESRGILIVLRPALTAASIYSPHNFILSIEGNLGFIISSLFQIEKTDFYNCILKAYDFLETVANSLIISEDTGISCERPSFDDSVEVIEDWYITYLGMD